MVRVERVAPLATDLFDVHQAGGLEPLEMPGGGGPRVAEPLGKLAGGHRAAAGVQRDQDVAPVPVGERPEDSLELVELAQPPGPPAQSVSFTAKCGKAIPGPIGRSSTRVAIRSQSAPILGCWWARRGAAASPHWKIATMSGPAPSCSWPMYTSSGRPVARPSSVYVERCSRIRPMSSSTLSARGRYWQMTVLSMRSLMAR